MIVAELNVREQPSMSAQRVATVDRGTVLLVGGYEPITADGYVWWRVSELTNLVGGDLPPLPTPIQALGGAVGFIATAKGDTRHAEAIAPRCPPILDLPHVAAMLGVERAHCLADRPLTFTGTLTCGPCEGMGPLETYEPRWLAAESYAWLATAPRVSWADLELHIPPDVAPDGIEEQGLFGSILRVVGHFNDPRSASCEIALYVDDDTSDPVADDHAEQACRQQFVVESFEILGTDPEYQPPF